MTKKLIIAIFLLALSNLTGCTSVEANSHLNSPTDEILVLAHGLGRSDWAMWPLAQRLEKAGFNVCLLDYATIGKAVSDVLAQTAKQIDACILNASKVHFVGHSLGGLVIRSYLQNIQQTQQKFSVGEVVLIGTPNQGSELADHLSDSWLMHLGGGISRALVTGNGSLGNTLGEINVNVGVIAGTKSSDLTSEQFQGANDGLVSVESTKLKSMSDFISLEVSHSQMRYSLDVAEQTIHFLKKGTFKH